MNALKLLLSQIMKFIYELIGGDSNIIHVHGKCTKVLEVNLKFNEHENLKKNIAPRVHLIIQRFLNIE